MLTRTTPKIVGSTLTWAINPSPPPPPKPMGILTLYEECHYLTQRILKLRIRRQSRTNWKCFNKPIPPSPILGEEDVVNIIIRVNNPETES